MNWLEILYFIIALVVMLIGLAGTVLPVIPGIPIIFGAAFLYALLTDFSTISGKTIIIFAVLTGASLLLDWLATAIGVKKMGGSYVGMLGALIGMIVGMLLPGVNIVGFILGAFIGAFVFEWFIKKETRSALRAGIGSFLGFLAGGFLKLVIGTVMIGVFVWKVIF